MDRGLASDFREGPGNFSKANIVRHHLKVNACRLRWIVKDPKIIHSDVTESYQRKLCVTSFNES